MGLFNRKKEVDAPVKSTPTMGRVMNAARKAAASLNYTLHIARANAWRSQYNPLRSLTISRCVSHLEAGERGAYSELQWLYRFIEKRDAVLGALVDRRLGAIEKLDWDIKIREEIPEEKKERAEQQRQALKAAYSRIENLPDALGFLALASFRGFSHLQKVSKGGVITRLDPVSQWFWVRNGVDAEWKFNPESRFGVTAGEDVDYTNLIIREVDRPINEIALICFVRKSLSQKDWDAFVEVYGVPAIFLVLPPELGEDDREEFQDVAENIIGDGRGVLPGNSDVKTVDNGARGVNPFRDHLKYQDEMLVLRGTGGKLTMLNDATGIGGSQGDVHERVFDELAQAEGTKISELIRRQLDNDLLLQEGYGDEEPLVYFDLGVNEETDAGEFLKGAALLKGMGKEVDDAQIEEKTGYKLRTESEVVKSSQLPVASETIRNRAGSESSLAEAAMAALHEARVQDNQELYERLAELMQLEDADGLRAALQEFSDELPEWIGKTAAQEQVWEGVSLHALLEGIFSQE